MLPQASSPKGFAAWKGDAVKKSGEELATQLDNQKFGWKPLGTYGNHYMGISRRKAMAAPKFTKPKWTSGLSRTAKPH
jgi:hypothetical protein